MCNPIDSSPPGSSVPGILQARTLEWVAISFSNAWKWKVKSLSRVKLFATPWTAAYQAALSMGFPGKSTGVGCHHLLFNLLVSWQRIKNLRDVHMHDSKKFIACPSFYLPWYQELRGAKDKKISSSHGFYDLWWKYWYRPKKVRNSTRVWLCGGKTRVALAPQKYQSNFPKRTSALCSLQSLWASLVTQLVKNPPAMSETPGRFLGREDPLEKGKDTHSSILAWRVPWTA